MRLRTFLVTALLASSFAFPVAAAAPAFIQYPQASAEPLTGCEYGTTGWVNGGHIAVRHRGTFTKLEGEGEDGCGGFGCDDRVHGLLIRSDGVQRPFVVEEFRDGWGRCRVNCMVETNDGTISYGSVGGHVTIDADSWTDFHCDDRNGVLFMRGELSNYYLGQGVSVSLEDTYYVSILRR